MSISRTVMIRVGLIASLAAVVLAIVFLRPGASSDNAEGEWTCSMHPQVRRPKPGPCPICGMDLIPVAQLAKEQTRIENRAGVYVEPITFRELFKEIRTVGKLDYNERQTAFITARVNGRVDRVHADFTGIQVKKDVHLVDIYSPDLVVGQSELIRALEGYQTAKKLGGDTIYAESTLDASRTKLRLLGLLPEQILEIENTKKYRTHLTIYAPIGGTVIEKNIRAGQYVKEGDVLYRIADLDPIWLYLDIYEYDLGWVNPGQAAEVSVEAYPAETFPGKVMFIDPFLDDKTRTVRARVNLPNPARKLRPGMYASVTVRVKLRADGTPEPTGLEGKYVCPMHPEVVSDKPGKCTICGMPLELVPELKLRPPVKKGHEGHENPEPNTVAPKQAAIPGKVLAIPASAVLDTGRRKVVYRHKTDSDPELVEVKLGPRADGIDDQGESTSYFLVLGGLKPGDRVVVRGAFLLDSQRQIEGKSSLLYPEGQSAVNLHSGHGAMPTPKAKGGSEPKQ